MDQCWTHFDRNGTDGSSRWIWEKEFTGNGEQVDVDFTCRIQSGETFKENMYLNENSSIVLELEFQIHSFDCTDNSECQDLTLTLFKGTIPVAQSEEFPQIGGSDADENLRWEIPVAENMTSWNKSGEEPTLQIEFSKPGVIPFLLAVLHSYVGDGLGSITRTIRIITLLRQRSQ